MNAETRYLLTRFVLPIWAVELLVVGIPFAYAMF